MYPPRQNCAIIEIMDCSTELEYLEKIKIIDRKVRSILQADSQHDYMDLFHTCMNLTFSPEERLEKGLQRRVICSNHFSNS